MTLTPRSAKAEIHLQYDCNLSCRNCNRMSFLADAHTPPMTIDDVEEFLGQARDLDWWPALLLIGGEPTMHPDFHEICRIAAAFAREARAAGGEGLVQLWSNQSTPEARSWADRVEAELNVSVVRDTAKPRSQILSIDDIFVSPLDAGLGVRPPCWQHASEICGISVDSAGYSLCAIGGAIDGVLDAGFRTRRLADLFDSAIAAALTEAMCGHCGHDIVNSGLPGTISREAWREIVDAQPKWRGMSVSPTWAAAYERLVPGQAVHVAGS